MRRFLTISLIVAVLGLMAFAQGCRSRQNGVPSEQYDVIRRELAAKQEEMRELEAQRKTLSDTIAKLNKDIANAHTQLDPLQNQIAKLKKEHAQLEENSAALKAEVAELKRQLSEKDNMLEKLRTELDAKTGQKWTVFAGGLKVPIDNEILFSSGKAELKSSGKAALKDLQGGITKVLNSNKVDIEYIRIDGHTDSDPIRKSAYKYNDNWELGAARANAVRAELDALGGWKNYKLYITSFADSVPVASNETKAGKAQNRRVEIYIVPKFNFDK